jgi:hypothetical protein
MLRYVAAAALASVLSGLAFSAALIYDNSDYKGVFAAGGYEYFDAGTVSPGTVEKFAFAYSCPSPSIATVTFYANPQMNLPNIGPGTKLESFSILNLPASTGAYSICEYTVPENRRFALSGGAFGYSIKFTTSAAGIALAKGGAGQKNEMLRFSSGSWNWFWFGGSPWAGMYFKVYREPFIQEITCDITGRKFEDLNANGLWDAGEPVIPGCELYLDMNNDGACQDTEPKVATDSAGTYMFENVPAPATYTIREIVQDRWIQTMPPAESNHQYVVAAQPNTVYGPLDFGNFRLPDSVTFSGRVTQGSDRGFGAVTIDLDLDGDPLTFEQTAVTDDGGYFTFTLPAPWTGRAYVRLPDGWTTHEGTVHENVVMNLTEDFVCEYHYDGGSGISGDSFRIRTNQQLLTLSTLPMHWDRHFVLTADIDLGGELYSAPIVGSNRYDGSPFSGTFDGCGLSIRNLHSTGGLFGYVRGAVIKNLGVVDAVIEQGEVAGAICNYNEGSLIENCFSTGTVSALYDAGGLCGWSYRQYKGTAPMPDAGVPQMRRCYSTAHVSVRHASRLSETYASAGGLCGYAEDSVFEDNYTRGYVEGTGCTLPLGFDIIVRTGGFVGCINNCTLLRNYSASVVPPDLDYSSPGGFCGRALGTNALTANVWDSDVCAQPTSACGTAMPTDQLQTISTYQGWDFQNTWRICDGTNYPRLQWEPKPIGDFVCPEGVELADLMILCQEWLGEAAERSADIAPPGGDGYVDMADLTHWSRAWEASAGQVQWDDACDIVPDGHIDVLDLLQLADQWLRRTVRYADIAPPDAPDGRVDMNDLALLTLHWMEGTD